MSRPQSLTQLAHQLLEGALRPGDLAVDATAGNGHDTLWLAHQVCPGGAVCAFDVQAQAVQTTAQRLQAAGLDTSVSLRHCGHEHLLAQVPADWRGRVSAITFNLGYLPGSDKQVTTLADTTRLALHQALYLLKTGGALSVLAYRGHPGGQAEADAVAQWLAAHAALLDCQVHASRGPVLYYCILRQPPGEA